MLGMALQLSSMQLSVKVKSDASELHRDMGNAEAAVKSVAATAKAANDEATHYHQTLARQSAAALRQLQTDSQGKAQEIASQARFTRQQLMTLQYTASDVAASLGSGASPLTVLMQQGGQVLQVFPRAAGAVLGVGVAVAAIGVPMAVVGARMAQIASQTRELTAIVKAMGNQAGVTAEELRKMAESAVNKGASRDDAYAATVALARNRQLQGSAEFREILDIAPDVAAVLGTTVANAAEKLGNAFGNGAAGVKKLDEELGFLTVEQAQHVRQMIQQGNQAGALGVAMQALQGRFGGAAVNMRGAWGGAVDEMGRAWNAFVERIAASDIAQRVAKGAANAAKAFQEGLRGNTDEENAIAATRKRVEVERELRDLLERPIKNPAMQGRATYLRDEVARLKEEEEKLYDDLRRKAREADERENKPANIGSGKLTDDEKKRLDDLRAGLDRERDAMKGTSAERQVRLAGLQAEIAALEAGRSPQAAKKEGLIAEERAQIGLNTAIGDTTRQLGTEARANLDVADAYLKSSVAGAVAEAHRQAMVESLQSGVNVGQRAAEILAGQAASQAAASAQSVAALSAEVAIREKVAAAAMEGVAALNQAELAAKVERETLLERIALKNADAETAKRLTAIIEAKTAAILRDADAEKKRNVAASISQQREQIELLKAQIDMIDASDEAQSVALAKQQAIIDLRRMGIDVTKDLTYAEQALADSYINSALQKTHMEVLLQNAQKVKEISKGIAEDICDFPKEMTENEEFAVFFAECAA